MVNDPKRKDWGAKKIMKFSKFKSNLGQRNMSEKCWNECRAAIMKFIQDHPNLTLDTKHLDPKLKNLMVFT